MDIELKDALSSIRGTVEALKTQQNTMQTQLDALDCANQERIGGSSLASKSFVEKLKENDQVARLIRDRKGSAVMTFSGNDAAELLERKTVLTATGQGFQTTGVMPIQRLEGITPEARQELTVRDALTARPTTMQVIDYVKVSTPMTIASPVAEASVKPENAVSFTSASERVRTIATWIPATRQVLDDFAELAGFIQSSLVYYVNLAEEIELLSGDGSGEHLHGLIPQATAFNAALLSAGAGWTRLDVLARAAEQLAVAKELAPTFAVVNTADWWNLKLTKDGFARYILAPDPQASVAPSLWGLQIIPTTNIAAGSFLMGSGSAAAAEIRDRMEVAIEVSTEHADYFTKNQVAIRAEKRLALVVKRPAAFITGSFSTSPAGA